MMGLNDLKKGVENLPSFVKEYGPIAGPKRLFGLGYWRSFYEVKGRSIFEEDWDVCIVLDACRADELERQQLEYDWLSNLERYPSLGSCTWNWMPRTFDTEEDDDFSNTIYVCANPFTRPFCNEDDFQILDEVWEYAWSEDDGTVLPRPVTDRAIHHGRKRDFDRMVVHYLQPHVPFLVDESVPLRKERFAIGAQGHDDDWALVSKGKLDRDRVIGWYRETLSKVLDDVDLLLSNLDADNVVVTADHGEAFGEWGLYGHPGGVDMSCLTDVPWVETTASDDGTYDPQEYDTEGQDIDLNEQLKALGYR